MLTNNLSSYCTNFNFLTSVVHEILEVENVLVERSWKCFNFKLWLCKYYKQLIAQTVNAEWSS